MRTANLFNVYSLLLLSLSSSFQNVAENCSEKYFLSDPPANQHQLNALAMNDYFSVLVPALILLERIPVENVRYQTFATVLSLLYDSKAKILLETGTARYGETECLRDGCSTILFGHFARITGAKLYSVDISEENCKAAKAVTEEFGDSVEIIHSDSITYIEQFDKGLVDFLYLDSYDFFEDDPEPSQEHHLKEIQAAYNKIHKGTVILLDDCNMKFGGKCKLVDIFLRASGWTLVQLGYQRVYLYESY